MDRSVTTPEAARLYDCVMNSCSEDPRRSPRSKVFLAATLECGGQALPVVLRDLSEHGALIEFEGTLDVDSELSFLRNELCVDGYVAWVDGNLAGISFVHPLNTDVVMRHVGRPQLRVVDEKLHRRPGLTRSGMSAEERRWAEEILRVPLRRSREK